MLFPYPLQLLDPISCSCCADLSRQLLTSWCSLQVLACVLLQPLGPSEDGTQCGELAAFCVHPSYRGAGRGDSLLDYVEQQARDKGIRRLVRPWLPSAACRGTFSPLRGFPPLLESITTCTCSMLERST